MSKNNRTVDRVQAVWNILGGEKGVDRLLRGELKVSVPARSWLEKDGVIYFFVTPDSGVMTVIAVLKGTLFTDDERIVKNIRVEADRRNLMKPNIEVAYLIREKFSDEEIKDMGLDVIITMHEPIRDPAGVPDLLRVVSTNGNLLPHQFYVEPGDRWLRADGFAFVALQVSA